MTKKMTESTIPYSLSRDTFHKLTAIADSKEVSVQEVIDDLVHLYLERKFQDINALEDEGRQEKRSFSRKWAEIPAILQTSDSKRNFNARSATIQNLSMGGALFTIPKTAEMEAMDYETPVEIIFYLNKEDEPLILQGRPKRLERETENYNIGVEFVDCEFSDYKELARYMLH
ncbi:MAG: PilZ domain-containing protein [Oceanidesulfovibrio sp.]